MAAPTQAGKIAFEPLFLSTEVSSSRSAARGRFFQALKPMLGFILIVGGIIFCIFAYTWLRVQILRLGYAIEKLEAQKAEITLQNKQLRIELAAFKSPANLERLAQQRLGMMRPKGGQVIFLSPNRGE